MFRYTGGVNVQRYDTLKYRQFDKLTDNSIHLGSEEVDISRDSKDFKDNRP